MATVQPRVSRPSETLETTKSASEVVPAGLASETASQAAELVGGAVQTKGKGYDTEIPGEVGTARRGGERRVQPLLASLPVMTVVGEALTLTSTCPVDVQGTHFFAEVSL